MVFDYPFIWAGLVAFAVLAYVVLDGFDLGVGLLFPFATSKSERDVMMNSVAPVWDGNETWLILGGGGLLAVFPLAYGIIMSALYIPIIAMLIGLILRGVAFEFRWRTERGRFLWDWAFTSGSALATFAQGVALGALVNGIHVSGRGYSGGTWDWLSPFSLLTGVALMAGYGLLGASWLIMKTSDSVQARAKSQTRILAIVTLGMIGIVSAWTPFIAPDYFQRWLMAPAIYYGAAVPLLLLACAFAMFRGLQSESDYLPFLGALGIFVSSFIGLGFSFYPYIVPRSVTIWEAAGPDTSLKFLLVGAVVLVPIILVYTAHAYWVFRGKVNLQDGYH